MENEKVESGNILEVAEPIEEITAEANGVSEDTVENDDTETGVEVQEEDTEKDEKKQVSNKQSVEDNSAARQARIRAEKEYKEKVEKIEKQAYQKGLIEAHSKMYIGKENPYTNTVIRDDYDIEEYEEMVKIDERGGDPIKEYSNVIKEKARSEAQKKIQQEQETKQKENQIKDIDDFVAKYPNINLKEMINDNKFSKFINGKIGNQPLTEIYEDYIEVVGEFKKETITNTKKIIANNISSPGSLGNSQEKVFDWDNMSDADFERYKEKAKNGELKSK